MSIPLPMGVRAGLCGLRVGLLTWLLWLLRVWPLSCMSPATGRESRGGVSGRRRGGGAGSGMSGAVFTCSLSLPPSLSWSPPLSLLLSFRGLISLTKALAPDHWLLLTAHNNKNCIHLQSRPCCQKITIIREASYEADGAKNEALNCAQLSHIFL